MTRPRPRTAAVLAVLSLATTMAALCTTLH